MAIDISADISEVKNYHNNFFTRSATTSIHLLYPVTCTAIAPSVVNLTKPGDNLLFTCQTASWEVCEGDRGLGGNGEV